LAAQRAKPADGIARRRPTPLHPRARRVRARRRARDDPSGRASPIEGRSQKQEHDRMELIFGSRQNICSKITRAIAVLGITGLIAAFFITNLAARADLMKGFGVIVFWAVVCVHRSLGARGSRFTPAVSRCICQPMDARPSMSP
jgi:hypothetical protein